MVLPNAIDHDTRRERIGWIGNPSRQCQPAPLIFGQRLVAWASVLPLSEVEGYRNGPQRGRRYHFALLHRIAALQPVGWFRLGHERSAVESGRGAQLRNSRLVPVPFSRELLDL